MQSCGGCNSAANPRFQSLRFIVLSFIACERKSKNTLTKLLFFLSCLIPILNVVPLLLTAFFAFTYWKSVQIHNQNVASVRDPCKKMTFDPEMCFSLGCDYYFFNITLNCTFTLNQNFKDLGWIIKEMLMNVWIYDWNVETHRLWSTTRISGAVIITFTNGNSIIIRLFALL